ncbi:alpha-amylase family glycosyl hydrolase [Streptosporangium sp. NPDC051023]|uniref:alpha-amylase family glycosyl hydrolase n=1 Tax=Streptosporangium sp. NPDC051023 TaxID=3155410 RepID=UPI00344CC61E
MTSWTDHAIWWQVYPLGFTGAPREAPPGDAPVQHRLRRLEGWLDYAVELGCSGIQLGPIFAAETHGYDTVDHFRIDPRLGDDADFDRLVAAAGRRGLRIVLDGVFNHVGRSFPAYVRASAEGPSSPAARWFRPRPQKDGTVAYDVFEGHDHLIALNHDEPAVLGHVVEVMNHWLGRGAAGWRLDAAYAVPSGFWRRVLSEVRRTHPEAWFVGEMIHGDYAAYAADGGLDSITQYELWKAIWSSLNDGNFFELAWTLDRHNKLLGSLVPMTFVGNHDVTRIATRVTDRRHLGHALAVLFTVGGTPSVYYGDEQAFEGVKEDRAGGDDAIRPEFPELPGDLPSSGLPTYRLHQRLIGLRRRNPWLVRAATAVEHLSNRAIALRSRTDDSSAQVVVLLNIGDRPYRFPVDLGGLTVAETSEPSGDHGDPATVPAHGWSVLVTGRPG